MKEKDILEHDFRMDMFCDSIESIFGYVDAVKMLSTVVSSKFYVKNRSNSDSSKTYLMFDNNTRLYKIGRSVNPEFIERTLAGQIPLIDLVGTCE